ncbi:glutathione S-transferase family protein [Cucumibacter marinus]|uniref:glutathione S-transferase family protein n=1 Tax=Cucumibacter marinus TaxID=1121252 RepID=UPI00040F5451|nr:glutathione S-transferase family protein [Cucumibacter marinus]
MSEIVLTTYDWVPDTPRGYVRDLRVRWALEEAGLPYRVESTPFHDRGPEHFVRQPFGQAPWLTDGTTTVFESGAMVLHIAEKSDVLMPASPEGRSAVINWIFAALNSVEMASLPYSIFKFTGDEESSPGRSALDGFLAMRLGHMQQVLTQRDWLVGAFSAADILMADVLRLVDRFDGLADYPACRDYVERATARPAFRIAFDGQMEHFAQAD